MKTGARRDWCGDRAGCGRSGYLLVECLIYLVLFIVVAGLALTALYAAWDHHKRLDRNADDIERALQVGERWRGDLRQASGRPEVETDQKSQSLRIPKAGGAVVYRFDGGRVERREEGGGWEIVLPRVARSQMKAEPRQEVTAWCWELELGRPQGAVKVVPLFSFLAVPGKEPVR